MKSGAEMKNLFVYVEDHKFDCSNCYNVKISKPSKHFIEVYELFEKAGRFK